MSEAVGHHKRVYWRTTRNKYGAPNRYYGGRTTVIQPIRKARRETARYRATIRAAIGDFIDYARQHKMKIVTVNSKHIGFARMKAIAALILEGRLHGNQKDIQLLELLVQYPVRHLEERLHDPEQENPLTISYAYPDRKGEDLLTELLIKSYL